MSIDLDLFDLVTIQKALGAYISHLEKDAHYSEEVSSWSQRIDKVRHKVIDILIDRSRSDNER